MSLSRNKPERRMIVNATEIKDFAAEAARYEAAASQDLQNASDSFERCDTDGFVSQWASGITADLNREKARICRQEGLDTFNGLYSGDTRVRAKVVNGRFGYVWLIDDCDQHLTGGRAFIPTGKRSKVQRELGLSERQELAPAWVCTAGSGNGLAGAHSVRVITFRTGCKWGSDATLGE
jgi:hypothetical protein